MSNFAIFQVIKFNMKPFKDGNNNNLRNGESSEPPPNYEDPPAYDEIIKIGMDDQIKRSKKEIHSGRKSRLHRPR